MEQSAKLVMKRTLHYPFPDAESRPRLFVVELSAIRMKGDHPERDYAAIDPDEAVNPSDLVAIDTGGDYLVTGRLVGKVVRRWTLTSLIEGVEP